VALLIETSLASGRDMLLGIAQYVREHQPWALYHEPHGLIEALPAWLDVWRGHGIIARVQTPKMAAILRSSRVPVVDILGVVPKSGFPLVHVDNRRIARMAAEHLMARGLRQFAFFGIRGENWSTERYEGLMAAVSSVAGAIPLYELSREAMYRRSWERAEDRLARWIRALPKPVGILVCSDQRGTQLLEGCRRAAVTVPDEVAVIGVDNDVALCEVCNPPLSSIDPGHTQVGYQAAALLAGLLRGAPVPKDPVLILPQRTVERLSSHVLAVPDRAVVAALRFIQERAHRALALNEVARHAGVSRSVLQRRFRRLLNRTVHQEILAARIEKAQDLLKNTNMPLSMVAERSGFRHQEYMGAVFKRRLGATPGSFRRLDRL
jgi:LacI family transcriptional regulator